MYGDFDEFKSVGALAGKFMIKDPWTGEILTDDYFKKLWAEQEQAALEYLRSKWPDAQLSEVRCRVNDVLSARDCEAACRACEDTDACALRFKKTPRVVRRNVESYENRPDVISYSVASTRCPRRNMARERHSRIIKYSGLTEKQFNMTFENYETKNLSGDITAAKARAMFAAREGSWLVLAGLKGTGKTHLAIAIMQSVMNSGRYAYFRLVSEMLESLRAGYADGTHDMQMKSFKNVPCLVLDDLGKERSTAAGYDYLYHILDYRYRNELQTIITTNAMTREELAGWGNADYLLPLLSRVDEMGGWVTISRAGDYRLNIAERKNAGRARQEAVRNAG